MLSMLIMIVESFIVCGIVETAVLHFAEVSLCCLLFFGFFGLKSLVSVLCPVSPVQVVCEVTFSAALLLAKATVPFVLGFLAGDNELFTCGFLSSYSVGLCAFFAPSLGYRSPVFYTFVDGY